jgi:iron(III) transport system substrate-binding protein
MRRGGRKLLTAAGAVVLAFSTAGCGDSGGSGESGSGGKPTLVLYNAQHRDLMELIVKGFTKETGIKVEMRSGEDPEMANQIVQEGAHSPADVFVTENSPAMTLVDGKQLFSQVAADTIAQVPAPYRPSDNGWVGFAARSTVLAHNSKQLPAARLPASIMDLAAPRWKGKLGIDAGGADFQAIVTAVLSLKGESATTGWLKGLKANAKIYEGNSAVMKAANDGQIQAGLIYHYYWYQDRAESGADSRNVELHFFGHKDPGAFVGVSGVGVLKSSKHQAEAQQLVKYLTGQNGQRILAGSSALEYSVSPQVPSNPKLKPLSQLDAPDVDIAGLNGPKVVALMEQAGLL